MIRLGRILCKLPGESIEIPWHQDSNYWPLEPMKVNIQGKRPEMLNYLFFVCLHKVYPTFCIGSVKSVTRWQVCGWPLMTSLLKMERWTCSRSPLCQRCPFLWPDQNCFSKSQSKGLATLSSTHLINQFRNFSIYQVWISGFRSLRIETWAKNVLKRQCFSHVVRIWAA